MSRRRLPIVALALALGLVAGACGSDNDSDDPEAVTDDLVASVASYDLAAGRPERFIVGLQTPDRKLVSYGRVDLRFTYKGRADQATESTTTTSEVSEPGPVATASYTPLAGAPPADARKGPAALSTSAGRGVYEANVGFDKAGFWEVFVTTHLSGDEKDRVRRAKAAFPVAERHLVPAVGDMAIPSDNLTLQSPGVAPTAVDSRAQGSPVPDPELHQTTIAAALAAGRPVVAVFSTPVYCVSRFCGPVTDLVAELARAHGDKAAFVHVEVWQDFEGQQLTKAAGEWLYRNDDLNEPWVFVIGRDGRIVARFDNVANRQQLEPVITTLA